MFRNSLMALALLLLPVGAGAAEADELAWRAWRVGPDGGLTTLERDALHRVFRVSLPDTPGYPGFSVETQWDVFGRAIQTLDPTGTGTASYDDLNRPTQVTPAAGQGATFQYLKDPVLKRHISRMTVTERASGNGAGTARGAPPRF